jgi:DNA-binding transcriptional ArsR family regulator
MHTRNGAPLNPPKEASMKNVVMDLEDMQTAAGRACRLMKVLSNPDRLLILCQLSQGERRVGELEELLGIGQPTLSQQLTVLRDEELVSTRREGKHIHYALTSPKALAVMLVLYEQFCVSEKE